MSSRNKFLSPDERQRAVALSRALHTARAACQSGQRNVATLLASAEATIAPEVTRLQYLEVRDAETLQAISTVDRPAVMAVAAFLGQTRLIDNVRLG